MRNRNKCLVLYLPLIAGYVCCVELVVCTGTIFNEWKNQPPHGTAGTKTDEFLSITANLREL